MRPVSLQNKRCSLLHPVPFNNWPQSRQAQSLCRSLGVSKSGDGKGGVGEVVGGGARIEEYIPLFSLLEDAPPDKYSVFIWATHTYTRASTHVCTHAHTHRHTYISFLSISPYFSPTNKKHSPHFSTSKLGSSTSKRPRKGACGTAFLQLTIHVTE